MVKFIGKNLRKMVVRPMKNSVKYNNFSKINSEPAEETKIEIMGVLEEQKDNNGETVTLIKETPKHRKENKKQKKNTEMINNTKLEKLETIIDINNPNATIIKEKNDNGLFEKDESNKIVLTEDNKMLLND